MLTTAIYDLETWDLNGEFGRLLCASVLTLPSGEMKTFRQDFYVKKRKAKNMADDRQLAVDLRDYLESHHVTAGWFTKGFDVSFLNTRLASYGERLLKPTLHLDGVWVCKGWRGLKAKSGKLKDVAAFFGLEEKKLEVPSKDWLEARLGDKKSMDVAVERCESDVRLTHEVLTRLLDLDLIRRIERYP